MSALALSIGIAIQNFPEGMAISLPYKVDGYSNKKAFIAGVLSGVVEPIAAVITILISSIINSVLPYLLAFAAGSMLYVIICELIPDSQEGEYSRFATFGVIVGFLIMMILDITLG
jgi:ZIP family zinc transporter